jgi:hypothetical protein
MSRIYTAVFAGMASICMIVSICDLAQLKKASPISCALVAVAAAVCARLFQTPHDK